MSHVVPFIKFFVEESMKKRTLAELHDADINRASHAIGAYPVDIAPSMFCQSYGPFIYQEPQSLFIYPSKEDSEDYLIKSEQMVESMSGVLKQAVFEVRGNKEGVNCCLYADSYDIATIGSAVRNFHPNSITEVGSTAEQRGEFFVYDFLPDAHFYKALTSHETFSVSPLNLVVKMLTCIERGEGAYQVIFKPLPGEVHDLVSEAIDCEWQAKQGDERHVPPSQQSGTAGKRLEYKSPEFRSYFSVCVRMILPSNSFGASVNAFISSYVYGKRAFRVLDNQRYSQEQVRSMLNDRLSFHTGFLVNSHELTGLLHLPYQVMEDRELSSVFAYAPVGDKPVNTEAYTDVSIGRWACGRSSLEVYLPVQREVPHVHALGVSRMGKSVLLSHIAVEKFRRGEAVFVSDPHGDLVESILRMVPGELMDKVVVIDFGLEDLTPQITLRENLDVMNPGKASDDLTEAMRDVASSKEKFWGPRMAYAFQCLYFIYCVVPELDMTHLRLLVSSSRKAKVLRTKVKAEIDHPIVRDFLEELEYIPVEMMMPVITRLSHLLIDEKSLRLFTQTENRISIHDIMESGKLCLINLSVGVIGRQRSSILSGLIDSLINNNALARASVPYDKRKPCTIIKDEFYLGPGDLDMQLSGLAKYGISVVFANQYLSQVEGMTREVMATAGTRIAFRLRRKDAEEMGRDFDVEAEEFTSLKKFEAIVKIEDEVVKINTPKPVFNDEDFSSEIMQRCFEKYYVRHGKSLSMKKERLEFDTL